MKKDIFGKVKVEVQDVILSRIENGYKLCWEEKSYSPNDKGVYETYNYSRSKKEMIFTMEQKTEALKALDDKFAETNGSSASTSKIYD